MKEKLNILFVGETALIQTTEVKGHDVFNTVRFGEAYLVMKRVMEKLGHTVTHIPCHQVPMLFPRTIEELQAFDVILVSDIGTNTFLLLPEMVRMGKRLPNLLKLMAQYVENGGGFCMIGGYMTFQGIDGKGHWKGSIIEKIMPVDMIYGDDRVEVPEGADLSCKPDSHPILKGLPAEWPYILGYNKTVAKPKADVLVEHEGDPIIAACSHGKGRVVAYTTDCAPHWAPAAMHEWEHYPTLWDNMLHWLAGK